MLVDEWRFRVGTALRVNGFEISGWLLREASDGGDSSFLEREFSGDGKSERGGSKGINDELRYSFPRGLSRACTF